MLNLGLTACGAQSYQDLINRKVQLEFRLIILW